MKTQKLLSIKDAEKLESASMVLAIPDWHCKKSAAKDATGADTDAFSTYACKFCLTGALEAAGIPYNKYQELLNATAHRLFGFYSRSESLIYFNDHPKTTNLDVAELLWVAAQKIRAFNKSIYDK